MSFCFESADGGVSEVDSVESIIDAQQAVDAILSVQGVDDPVWAEQADADGVNDDGEQCYRMLVWASEEDASNDSGAKAIGQLSWVGNRD